MPEANKPGQFTDTVSPTVQSSKVPLLTRLAEWAVGVPAARTSSTARITRVCAFIKFSGGRDEAARRGMEGNAKTQIGQRLMRFFAFAKY